MDKVTRPQMGLAIYPEVTATTTLTVTVSSSNITIIYDNPQGSPDTLTVSYIGKSLKDLATEINSSSFLVKAAALSSETSLGSGDFITTTSRIIPSSFPVVDRTENNGVILRLKKYTVLSEKKAEISLLQPYIDPPTLPWFPRISVGSFSQMSNNQIYHFEIPEYQYQTWSTKYGRPFKDVTSGPLIPLGNNAFQATRYPLYWNGENITIYNGETPVLASNILDIDINNGIIYLKDSITVSDELSADYSYIEESFEYTEININAHFTQNPSVIDKYVVVYLRPVEGTSSSRQKKCVFHIVADSLQEAIDRIETEDLAVPVAILGAYNIQQVSTAGKITILDTRSLGGGLISSEGPHSPVHNLLVPIENSKQATAIDEKYSELRSFWDASNWDGEPYPGAAAVAMEIPSSLKEFLPTKDIKAKAKKYLAAGVYPVVSFYEEPLPATTGLCTQVSSAFNTSLTETVYGTSGSFWLPTEYKLPQDTVLSNWYKKAVTIQPRVYDNGILEASNLTGVFQTYLKSSPNAVIKWKERSVNYFSGSDSLFAGETYIQRSYADTRDVPPNTLTKGYLTFKGEYAPKHIKDIEIVCPLRKDKTGEFGDQLLSEINKISNRRSSLVNISGQVISQVANVTGFVTETSAPYAGCHPRDYFLVSSASPEWYAMYSGSIEAVGANLHYSLTGAGTTGLFYKFNPTTKLYVAPTASALVTVTNPLNTFIGYLKNRLANFGSSDNKFTKGKATLKKVLSNITGGTPAYAPTILSDFYLSPDDTVNSWIGNLYPVTSDRTDVAPGINQRYRYLEIYPSLMSYAEITPSWEGTELGDMSGLFYTVMTGVAKVKVEFNRNIYDFVTYSGDPVATHWYAGFDKWGKRAGRPIKDVCDIHDSLRKAHKRIGSPNYILSGADTVALNDYFRTAESMLETVYSGFKQTLFRGGILDGEAYNLVYAYGWYAKNAGYYLANTGSSYYYDKFTGMYYTGLHTLVKYMTTTDGKMYETSYVDQNPGPFSRKVPAGIFKALSPGVECFPDIYLPLAQAVFNTVTGVFSDSGSYSQDASYVAVSGGREADIAPNLVTLYENVNHPYEPWQPIKSDFSNIVGMSHLFDNVNAYAQGTSRYSGSHNSTVMWKYFDSGSVDKQVSYIKGLGCNTVTYWQNYYAWAHNNSVGSTKYLDDLRTYHYILDKYRVRAISTIFDNFNQSSLDMRYTGDFVSTAWNADSEFAWYPYPGTGRMSTTNWWHVSGVPYVREAVRAIKDYDSTLLYCICNVGTVDVNYGVPFLKFMCDAVRSKTGFDNNPNHKGFVGYEASFPYTGSSFKSIYVDWSALPAYPTNEIISVHPYTTFKQPSNEWLRLAKTCASGLGSGKPVLVTEVGLYQSFSSPDISIDYITGYDPNIGIVAFQAMAGLSGTSHIFGNNGSLAYDGSIRKLRVADKFQELALNRGVNPSRFTKFTKVKDQRILPSVAPGVVDWSVKDVINYLDNIEEELPLINNPDVTSRNWKLGFTLPRGIFESLYLYGFGVLTDAYTPGENSRQYLTPKEEQELITQYQNVTSNYNNYLIAQLSSGIDVYTSTRNLFISVAGTYMSLFNKYTGYV